MRRKTSTFNSYSSQLELELIPIIIRFSLFIIRFSKCDFKFKNQYKRKNEI